MSKPAIEDLLYLAGGALIAGGAAMIYVPAGVIVAGLLLMSLGIAAAKESKKS